MHPKELHTTPEVDIRSTNFCLGFRIFCLDNLSQFLHNTRPDDDVASTLLHSPTAPTACLWEYHSNLSCCTKTQSLLASAHCFCPCSRVWPGLQSMLCWLGLPSRMRSSHPRSGLTSELRSTSFPSFVIHHCMTLALMKLAVVHDSACDGSSFMRCCDSHCLLFRSWQHVMYLPGQFFQLL